MESGFLAVAGYYADIYNLGRNIECFNRKKDTEMPLSHCGRVITRRSALTSALLFLCLDVMN